MGWPNKCARRHQELSELIGRDFIASNGIDFADGRTRVILPQVMGQTLPKVGLESVEVVENLSNQSLEAVGVVAKVDGYTLDSDNEDS